MAATKLAAIFEGTGDTSEFSNVVAAASVQTGVAHCNTRSIKLDTSSPAVEASVRYDGPLADAGRRITFWYRFETTPAGTDQVMRTYNSTTQGVIALDHLATNILQVRPIGGTNVAGTTVLSTGTWYRITFAYTITSTTIFQVKVYINGVLEITVTNSGTLTRTGSQKVEFPVGSAAGINCVKYVDDIYIDDGSDLADPGDLRCTAKRPNANGGTNTFDTITGAGSGFGAGRSIYVNDRPISAGSQLSHANTTTATENFAIEALTSGDKDISLMTLVARVAWAFVTGVSTDTIYNNGSASVPSPVIGTAGIRTLITDSASWTANGSDVGMGRPTGNATDAVLQDCGMVFIYRPVALLTLSGTLTSSGGLPKQANKALAGTLSSAGAIVKKPLKIVAGTLTSAGALVKKPTKTFAGTLTTAGALVAIRVRTLTLAGTLTTAGAVVKMPMLVRTGGLTSSGALVKRVSRTLAGTLTSSGILVKRPKITRSGTLTTAGSLVALMVTGIHNAYKGGFANAKRLSRGRGWR